jgi:glycosyltransferase involved in cell wall biosynthesis
MPPDDVGFRPKPSADGEKKAFMANPPRIGILVVAYNAETTLLNVLQRIPVETIRKIEEVFVFDDASQDRTHEVGAEFAEKHGHAFGTQLSVYKNPVNLMYGGNQRRGYQYAIERGLDIVVLLHGDGQYAPEVMQELLTPLERGEADMVMGSRMMVPGAALRGNMPRYKYFGNKVLTWMENRLAGTRLSEFHSGYRAYSVRALRNIPLDSMTWNWHFDTQIILEFLKRGHRIKEVPIPTYYGDEICHVNGVPYAMNCVRETLNYALKHRWRAHGARARREWDDAQSSDRSADRVDPADVAPAASLPSAPRPQE